MTTRLITLLGLLGCICPAMGLSEQRPVYEGYLFAYFEGSGPGEMQEQLRFAVSADGYDWAALNENNPVIPSDEIAQTGGIRDPHLLRGEGGDGFYLVATDMFTVRDGWGANPGIVMMRSDNLTDWTATAVDLAEHYPATFGEVQWVWAPQTIYDPDAGKYLVYFTIRFRGQDNLDFYSAYANEDFTGFEDEPTLMFRARYGAIDGDIVYHEGVYHLFFKGNTKDEAGHEYRNGIQRATSESLRGPWVEDFRYLDAYASFPTVVEGSSVFRRNDTNEYILMYDLYRDGRYEFQRSTNLENFTPTTESFTKNFHPRHGSVIGITRQEAVRLNDRWGGVTDEMLRAMAQERSYRDVPDPTVVNTGGNPIIDHVFTADPAPLVVGDTVYLYVGHDNAGPNEHYNLPEWYVYSSRDLVNWRFEGVPLIPTDFRWATRDAYAGHVAERDGRYYFYAPVEHRDGGKAIGVAVADTPVGPFRDARGTALITGEMTPIGNHSWEDIDPAVFTDDDGTPWLFWGNVNCYFVKLNDNMTELAGEIHRIPADQLFDFTEAPWVHKRGDLYYLTYASGFPEKIAYSTAESIEGPWTPRGLLAEVAGNSNTIHQGIITFKDRDYFFYHNGALQRPNTGGSYRRSVCIEDLRYNADGTMRRVVQTSEGVGPVPANIAHPPDPEPFESAGNPILGDGSYYSADAASLSHEGKLYLYFGNDRAGRWTGGFVMPEYGVMVTDDPASGEWELYRNNLDPDAVFDWATGHNAYAGHVAQGGDGRFYWYAPVEWENEDVPDRMAIGVAVSDSPTGPWTDPIGRPLVAWPDVFGDRREGNSLIDPNIFRDDDGQVYLYWGSWWDCYVVKLAPSMIETEGEHIRQEGLDGFFEAPWVIRRGATYYMLYDWKIAGTQWTPSNYQAAVGYATADSPMGPWDYRGIILHGTSATTVHPSMIEHDGAWWLTYHTKDAEAGGHFRRSIAIDRVEWDGDRIVPVEQTWADPPSMRLTNNLAVDAEASASHTEQPPMTLWALNDGRPETVMLPPDFWGNYRSNENDVESDWVRYDWDTPVCIAGVGLQFIEDPNWIRSPARWTVEVLNEEGDWSPVDVEAYPTRVGEWIEVSFPAMTGRAVRVTFWGKPNGAYFHSVALTELEVYAEQAEVLPGSVVTTAVGEAPRLPDSIDLSFDGAGVLPVPVVWEDVPAERYEAPGRFTVRGRAIGQAASYLEAQVKVEEAR